VQPVRETEGERHFGADDDEGYLFALGEGDEAGDIVGGDGEAGGFEGDAGVAGGANHAGRGGRREEGADESVFASAGADDEDGARKGERGGKGGHVAESRGTGNAGNAKNRTDSFQVGRRCAR
jgi:hypothetical protein